MKEYFKSSFTRGGSILAPEIICIDDKNVTWTKNRGFDWLYLLKDSLTIKKDRITSVTIIDHLIGVSLYIMTNGESDMMIRNLKLEDAEKMKSLLI